MKHKFKRFGGWCFCGLWLPLMAQTAVPRHEDVKLKNGLRVIVVEDHSAPVYAIAVIYNVGSRDEKPGHTGFAHLFEHLMYEGSANVGKGEHMALVQENGGGMNGNTDENRTAYFETLPSNQMDLGLFLESDRMRSLAVTQANLDNQRNAVQEERRLRYDNQPYGKSSEALQALVFDNFAYKHSTIGSMEDLNSASISEVQNFFKTYYAPNNAVITLVGDFKSAEALKKVEKYFGTIPAQPPPPSVDATEPRQTSERRETITDDFAKLPLLMVAYKTVPENTPTFVALDMAMSVLCDGKSSRFYRRLVKQDHDALQVDGGMQESRGTTIGLIRVNAGPKSDLEKIQGAIDEEISRLAMDGPEDWEMDKVRNGLLMHFVRDASSDLRRAINIGEGAVYFNDPMRMYTDVAQYDAMTPDKIRAAAREYLIATNRSVLITLPKAKPGAEQEPIR